MNESFNPQVAAEKARETYRKTALQFEDLALNTPVSEGLPCPCREERSSDARGL